MLGEHKLASTDKFEQHRSVKKIIIHPDNFRYWELGYLDIPDDYDIGQYYLVSFFTICLDFLSPFLLLLCSVLLPLALRINFTSSFIASSSFLPLLLVWCTILHVLLFFVILLPLILLMNFLVFYFHSLLL